MRAEPPRRPLHAELASVLRENHLLQGRPIVDRACISNEYLISNPPSDAGRCRP